MTSKLEEISTHLGGLDTLVGGEVGDQILPPLIRLMAILFGKPSSWVSLVVSYMFIILSFGEFFLLNHIAGRVGF